MKLDTYTYRCPQCAGTDLHVDVLVRCTVEQYQGQAYPEIIDLEDVAILDEDQMSCDDCGHQARADAFLRTAPYEPDHEADFEEDLP